MAAAQTWGADLTLQLLFCRVSTECKAGQQRYTLEITMDDRSFKPQDYVPEANQPRSNPTKMARAPLRAAASITDQRDDCHSMDQARCYDSHQNRSPGLENPLPHLELA